LELTYGEADYFSFDIVKEMAKYLKDHEPRNNRIVKQTVDAYEKTMHNFWKANKYPLSIFFYETIINMKNEDSITIYNDIMHEFITMVERIYNFIDSNN